MQADQPLLDLVFMALDHGVGSIAGAGGETLVPFLLAEDANGGRALKRFMGETWEGSAETARAAAKSAPASVVMIAVAFDGTITLDGTKFEAIIVQAQRRGTLHSANYAQRYKRDGSHIEAFGNAAYLGEGEPLIGDPPMVG